MAKLYNPYFSYKKLTDDEVDIWYYAYCKAQYQNRQLHRPEVCAVIGALLNLPVPPESQQHYKLFDMFDDAQLDITKWHKDRVESYEQELKTKVLGALQTYLDEDAIGRDRATVFAEIPERPVYPELYLRYRKWPKTFSPDIIFMYAYQHIPLYIIANECKNTDGSAASEETLCKTAGICLMENEYGSYEICGAKQIQWLRTPNHEYARAMAEFINPHKDQYAKNTQKLLDRYKGKLEAAKLKVYIVRLTVPDTGPSSQETARRPGPKFAHNILESPSPDEEQKEK